MTIFMTVGFPVMMSFRAKTFDLWVKGEGEGGGGGGELKNNVFKFEVLSLSPSLPLSLPPSLPSLSFPLLTQSPQRVQSQTASLVDIAPCYSVHSSTLLGSRSP